MIESVRGGGGGEAVEMNQSRDVKNQFDSCLIAAEMVDDFPF